MIKCFVKNLREYVLLSFLFVLLNDPSSIQNNSIDPLSHDIELNKQPNGFSFINFYTNEKYNIQEIYYLSLQSRKINFLCPVMENACILKIEF